MSAVEPWKAKYEQMLIKATETGSPTRRRKARAELEALRRQRELPKRQPPQFELSEAKRRLAFVREQIEYHERAARQWRERAAEQEQRVKYYEETSP